MAKKSITQEAKAKVVEAAESGAGALRDIAGEAIRAAAMAAAGVALQRTADTLRGTARKAEAAAPNQAAAQPRAKPRKRAKARKSKKAGRRPAKAKRAGKAAKAKRATKAAKAKKRTSRRR